MFAFAWPYVFGALPLPLLVALFTPRVRHTPGALLRIPFLSAVPSTRSPARGRRLPAALALLAWCCLVAAAARPQFIGDPVRLPLSGRDLLLAVDISGSMRYEDMVLNGLQSTRLQVVKSVAGNFIERRQGDRLGLILFGSQAYLQAPLTFDRTTVSILLHEAEIGLAGKETAIGDAIGLAVKRLRNDSPGNNRVLVLLTDGANNAGAVEPLRAAALAAQQGLRIYTIGVGAEEMIVRGTFGQNRVNPSADLDERMLTDIAAGTGGHYFRARDTEELVQIYALLDELEPAAVAEDRFRPVKDLYYWPLALALAASVLLAALALRRYAANASAPAAGAAAPQI